MSPLKKLSDYTKEEVKKFDEMHVFLKQYNESVQARLRKPSVNPPFNDHEMFMYSRYRELLIASECTVELD
ncbi:MAG: hypothetical protein HOP30_10145 [Cyclobacteriaceae bacterium]|nr:hypothetical protein [Cyclobacteriaceae bacterium]